MENVLATTTIQIVSELKGINASLGIVNQTLSNRSFFDSQFFSALIGATSALFIFFLKGVIDFFKQRKKQNYNIYMKLTEDGHWSSPESIYSKARYTSYGHTHTDSKGNKTVVPEKPISERLVIELRKRVKYWNFRNLRLRRMFKKYERVLSSFGDFKKDDPEFQKNMKAADILHKKIMNHVYSKTNESEWTLR